MKRLLLTNIALFICLNAHSAVTLNITQGGFTNGSSASNGMPYGIVVDTANNGFTPGAYGSFDVDLNGQFLEVGGDATDDWFVFGGTQGSGQTPPETASVFPLGDGSIGNVSNVDFTNLSQGMEFAVMWFPSNTANLGDLYGFATDTGGTKNMVIPPNTQTSNAPSSLSTKEPSFSIVPEPSQWAMMLGGLVLCLAVWRRRQGA